MSIPDPHDDPKTTALRARIAGLRERFASRAGADRAALLDARLRGDREELRERAHRLAGSSATFGYPEVGTAAFALQAAVDAGVSETELLSAAQHLADQLGAIADA